MRDGWIRLHRKIRQNPIFNDHQLFRLWMICLTEAYFFPTTRIIGKQKVEVEAGQFPTGRFDLHEKYNNGLSKKDQASEKTVWRWLEKLQDSEYVTINSTNKYSVVTVNNWSFYQGSDQENDQQMTNKRPTDDQQMTTNKKVKESTKKGKKEEEKIHYAEFVSLTQEEYTKLVTEYGEEFVKQAILVLDNYKGQNGKKYKSDYRAMLNWVVERVVQDMRRGGARYAGQQGSVPEHRESVTGGKVGWHRKQEV